MRILEQIVKAIQTMFLQKNTLQEYIETEETLLCVFLQHGTDFIFVSADTEQTLQHPERFYPLLIPISTLGQIENNFCKINDFMFQEFDIALDKVQVAKEFTSLLPVKKQNFYYAVVHLTNEDMSDLNKGKQRWGTFYNLNFPYLSLHQDKNIFFTMLVKLFEN